MAAIDPSFDLALGRMGLTSSKRDALALQGITNAEVFYMLDVKATEDLMETPAMASTDNVTKNKLLAFQEWLHEQSNCVSLDAFTDDVLDSTVLKIKERENSVDPAFDRALSVIGLTASQKDAIETQGVTDAKIFAVLDKEAMDDLMKADELKYLNTITKFKLRAFQTWINENPGQPLDKFSDGSGKLQMVNMKRKETGLVPLDALPPAYVEETKEGEEKTEEVAPTPVSAPRSAGAPAAAPVAPQTKDGLKLARVTKTGTLKGHESSVRGLVYYELKGKPMMATCSYDKTIKLWDLDTNKEVTSLTGHTGCVNSLTKYIDGDDVILISGSNDKAIILWNLTTRDTTVLKKHTSDVRSLIVYEIDGKSYLASASSDGTIKIWDLATKEEVKTLTGHTSYVYTITQFNFGKTPILASGGNDNDIILWDLKKMEKFAQFTAHPKYIWSLVSYEWKGEYFLVSGSADATIKVWKLGGKDNPVATLEGHSSCVNALKYFTQNGVPCLVSGDAKGNIRFWNLGTKKLMTSLDLYPTAITTISTFFNKKSYLAIGHYREIELWSE